MSRSVNYLYPEIQSFCTDNTMFIPEDKDPGDNDETAKSQPLMFKLEIRLQTSYVIKKQL